MVEGESQSADPTSSSSLPCTDPVSTHSPLAHAGMPVTAGACGSQLVSTCKASPARSVKGAPLTCETSTPPTALHYTTTSPSSLTTTIPTPPYPPPRGARSARAASCGKRGGEMGERERE
eukprot:2954898-Rhodomonas_salina.1